MVIKGRGHNGPFIDTLRNNQIYSGFPLADLMAQTHCTVPGQGQGTGQGTGLVE